MYKVPGTDDVARLIDLLFTGGLYYGNGGFRTRENADGFSVFDLLETPQDKLASAVISYWNTLIPWLQEVAELLVVA